MSYGVLNLIFKWYDMHLLSQPYYWKSGRMTLTFLKWGLGSPSWLKTSKFDFRGQNILHWGVFYIIGNLLKCRCRKWARMSYLDISSTSYDKKKGRESNWQFDSWPLKVRNRPDPGACKRIVTHRWKALDESYMFALDLIPIGGLSKKLWPRKVARVHTEIVSRLLLGNPGIKNHLDVGANDGILERILYGGRWWLPPSLGHGESCESRVTRGLS
jgi:hypothetical protein